MADLVERGLRKAEIVERVRSSLKQYKKVVPTQSLCKFISCGGTCGHPECVEKGLNVEWVRSPSAKLTRFGATTAIQLPAPAESVSDSESEPVELVSITSMYFETPIIFDTSSDNQEESGVGCSNVIKSDDSELPRIPEMSKDSLSPHTAWKTLRNNADWPSKSRRTESKDSPSAWKSLRMNAVNADSSSSDRRTETRQVSRGARWVKKRSRQT